MDDSRSLTRAQALAALARLAGLVVTRVERTKDASVILELGDIVPDTDVGLATLTLPPVWRVESQRAVSYGSVSTAKVLEGKLPALMGAVVAAVSAEDDLPELIIEFADGRRLRTFMAATGQPQWGIAYNDPSWHRELFDECQEAATPWLGVRNGRFSLSWFEHEPPTIVILPTPE